MPADLKIDQVPIETLVMAAWNPRQMPEEEMASLRASLTEFGFVDPVIARRKDRLVIGGHQRLIVAKERDFEKVPGVWLDGISDAQVKKLNIGLNRIGGRWDPEKLRVLVVELDSLDVDMASTGLGKDEISGLLEAGGDDDLPDPGEDGKKGRRGGRGSGPHEYVTFSLQMTTQQRLVLLGAISRVKGEAGKTEMTSAEALVDVCQRFSDGKD